MQRGEGEGVVHPHLDVVLLCEASTRHFLSPLRLITTVSYFKIVQALMKHYLYSIQLKLELDVLNIEK